ncbi:MAG: serine/threonine protein kinase [Myxococcales bacterium]|nr:serine/threonine protein kinase [Myxococcales bacterium]
MLRQLERYEILHEIAHGGMATVYRARDTKLDRMVALKVMHPHLRGAEDARLRFAREARTIAKLHHPNIVEIYDFSGQDSAEVYIATELLTGPTLKAFAQAHPAMPVEIAACVGIHIARALIISHHEGVVHRDVKPENVLIHEDRTIKLTDFGLAQMRDTHSMTVTGQILGSPGHMAPEQVEGKECDARCDIFSLGTVLYVLSVGESPFTAPTPHSVLMQIAHGDYIEPLRKRPAVGAHFNRVIVRCMQTSPDARYASAEELEQALSTFAIDMGIEDPTRALKEYLRDPQASAKDIETRSIERLLHHGDRSREKRDYPEARDYYERALALEPGQPAVLASLAAMARAGTRIRAGVMVAGILAALMSVLLVFVLVRQRSAITTFPSGRRDGSIALGNSESRVTSLGKPAPVEVSPSAESASTGTQLKRKRGHRAISASARRVVFRPFPQNVTIAVDDAAPRPFGPDFQEIHLEPGVHRFQIVGAQGCCVNQSFELNIPPGDAPYVVQRSLSLRPAILVVRSNVPADVVVGNGDAKGRSHSALLVELGDSFRSVQRVTVSAPERSAVSRSVVLEAGKVTDLDVALEKP